MKKTAVKAVKHDERLQHLAAKTNLPVQILRRILAADAEFIAAQIEAGETVELEGLGRLLCTEPVRREFQSGRDTRIVKEAWRQIKFKPSAALRRRCGIE